tara:strand:+ start:1144 stop:1878 length:735 start_codon:yes stop_codon:yes gene_type:complete
MIQIKGLHKKFYKKPVLNGIDLNIPQGSVFGILGPNGSGKTTLLKTILGMVIPNQGKISILGSNILKSSSYRNNISYLPQAANFPPNLKVSELFSLISNIRGNLINYSRLIKKFKLSPFLNEKINTLSGGTKQKINIALAFMFNSPLIILDEPTSGLDPISLIQLKKLIQTEKNKGKTILITSHIMSFIEEVSNEIIFLLEGKIYIQGKINEIKLKAKSSKKEFDSSLTDFEYAIASKLKDKNV